MSASTSQTLYLILSRSLPISLSLSLSLRIDHIPSKVPKKAIMNAKLPKGLRDASQTLDIRSALNSDPWLETDIVDGGVDQAIRTMTANDYLQCQATGECDVYYDHDVHLSQRIPHHAGYEDITFFDSEGEFTLPCDDLFEEKIVASCTLHDGSILV